MKKYLLIIFITFFIFPLGVFAESTVWDFNIPGEYTVDADVEIAAGLARLTATLNETSVTLDEGANKNQPQAIIADESENYYLARISSAGTFSTGEIIIEKFNSADVEQWQANTGESALPLSGNNHLRFDSEGNLIFSHFILDVFFQAVGTYVAKIDADTGSILWDVILPIDTSGAGGLEIDSNDDIIVFSEITTGFAINKLDSSDGSIIFTEEFESVSSDGDALTNLKFATSPDDEIYVTADVDLGAQTDVYLAKYDENASFLWDKYIDIGGVNNLPSGIYISENNIIYIIGYSPTGDWTLFRMKLNTNGDILALQTQNPSGGNDSYFLHFDFDENTQTFYSLININSQEYVARYDDRLNEIWVEPLVGGVTTFRHVVKSGNNNFIVTGHISAPGDLHLSKYEGATFSNTAQVVEFDNGFTFRKKWHALAHQLSSFSQGDIQYQISPDAGTTWYFHDGTQWTSETGAGYPTETSSLEEINSKMSSFLNDLAITLPQTIHIRAFLHSDGDEFVGVEDVSTAFDLSALQVDFFTPEKPTQLQITSGTQEGEVIFTFTTLQDAVSTNNPHRYQLVDNKGEVVADTGITAIIPQNPMSFSLKNIKDGEVLRGYRLKAINGAGEVFSDHFPEFVMSPGQYDDVLLSIQAAKDIYSLEDFLRPKLFINLYDNLSPVLLFSLVGVLLISLFFVLDPKKAESYVIHGMVFLMIFTITAFSRYHVISQQEIFAQSPNFSQALKDLKTGDIVTFQVKLINATEEDLSHVQLWTPLNHTGLQYMTNSLMSFDQWQTDADDADDVLYFNQENMVICKQNLVISKSEYVCEFSTVVTKDMTQKTNVMTRLLSPLELSSELILSR